MPGFNRQRNLMQKLKITMKQLVWCVISILYDGAYQNDKNYVILHYMNDKNYKYNNFNKTSDKLLIKLICFLLASF